jgi:hypothetical protein
MSGIVLRAPDLPGEATAKLVSDLIANGAFGLAFSGAVVVAGNAALQALKALGVEDDEWPDFEAAAAHDRSALAATAARAAVARRGKTLKGGDMKRAKAALQVLEATANIHARTRYGVPEGAVARGRRRR